MLKTVSYYLLNGQAQTSLQTITCGKVCAQHVPIRQFNLSHTFCFKQLVALSLIPFNNFIFTYLFQHYFIYICPSYIVHSPTGQHSKLSRYLYLVEARLASLYLLVQVSVLTPDS